MTFAPESMPVDYDSSASYFYTQQAPDARAWNGAAPAFNIAHLFEANLRQQLAKLKSLPTGWDGEDAEPISALTLKNAQEIGVNLLAHTRPPEITPSIGDTIAFEWESEAGSALLEIGHTTYSFLMKTKSGKRATDMGSSSNIDIADLGSHIQRSLF